MSGTISLNAAAEQLRVHQSVVDDWVRLYQTYDPALKEAAVKDDWSGRDSIRGICKIHKTRSTCQRRDWIMVYNGHKDFKKQTGGSCTTKGRETNQAERIAVAKACIANGKNYGEVAIAYNVSYQKARSGTLKYIEGGEAAVPKKRIAQSV